LSDDLPFPGGTVKIEQNSVFDFDKIVYLGEGGVIELGVRATFNVGGDFYFKKDGIYKIGVLQGSVSKINVTGETHIEEGAVVR
jgi:hypothetical protein